MKFLKAVWNIIRWFVDAFTDTNGYACLAKIGGAATLIIGLINLRVDLVGAGLGSLAVGKGLDAVVPKEPGM